MYVRAQTKPVFSALGNGSDNGVGVNQMVMDADEDDVDQVPPTLPVGELLCFSVVDWDPSREKTRANGAGYADPTIADGCGHHIV